MTERLEIDDWRNAVEQMVAAVKHQGRLSSPGLEPAFLNVPRHVFVPEYLRIGEDENGFAVVQGWVDQTDPSYLTTVYSDESLVTQTKPVEGQPGSAVWTSSSSMPSVMADMIEELGIEPGMTVLESGTGTGYNAAILCHLLGDEAVTTVEIDPQLLKDALARLQSLGYQPSTDPARRLHDRVLATHAVDNIPYDWIRWSKPGAVILTDLRPPAKAEVGAWAKLTVDADGKTATGRLMPPRGYFMSARKVVEFADIGTQLPELSLEEHERRAELMEERATAVSPSVFEDEAFALYFWRQNLDVWWWYDDGQANVNAPDGSWAHVRDGLVSFLGPRDLWDSLESAYAEWLAAGEPRIHEWLIRVTADGQTVVVLPGK